MKAYKGFDKDMKCRGFAFRVGESYAEPEAILCKKGFHACENPLDVLNHYALLDDDGNANCFAEVELEDVTEEREENDSKRVGKKIHINAGLSLKGLITAGVEFLFESTKAAEACKDVSAEKFAKLAASGDRSQLAASGYRSKLAASGDGSQLAASGDRSQLAASGDGSQLAASGDGSQLAASGDRSVVMNAGINGQAMAAKGCWITLAEWDRVDGKMIPLSVVTKQVDGAEIKADTWYQLQGGQFVEIED